MTAARARSADTLARPELDWLVQRVRRRLARGRPLSGRVSLDSPSREQRAALEALLGRSPGRGTSLSVDLGELNRLLSRAGLTGGLAAAVQQVAGQVHDESSAQAELRVAFALVVDAARQRCAGRPELQAWLHDVTASGLVRRLARSDPAAAGRLLTQALDVADRLPAGGITLAELAAATLRDSHALDLGQPVGTLAVRAAARVAGKEPPRGTGTTRDIWAAVGVLCDELSAPVLVLNLRGNGSSLCDLTLRAHADAGEPARLMLRELVRHPPTFCGGGAVFVCENPSVLAAAADRLGASAAPLVCLEGQRKSAARVLLGLLAATGAELVYHGDFDWGGLTIGNGVIRDHGARPWRYRTADYLAAPAGPRLSGHPVEAVWDRDLAAALRARGVAVHEEALLDDLLTDLTTGVACG